MTDLPSVTVHCGCGATHHVTVYASPKDIEAAVRRVLADMQGKAVYETATTRAQIWSGTSRG